MARRRWRLQTGAALLIFLILLVVAALTYLVSSLTPEMVEARRAQKTSEALVQARDALIGYALKYRDEEAGQGRPDRMYGYLPLPDLGSSRNINVTCTGEGCDANTFTGLAFDANGIGPTVVGRFPWRTLGIAPLRDGYSECLWLIVSSLHSRIQRSSPSPVLPPMNWDTLGQLDVVIANGTNALASALANAHARPVAIVFSPGPPLPGQDRSPSATDNVGLCGGNYNVANYLDPAVATTFGGITNYLGGTNAASGATGDSNPANDPDLPKGMLTQGKIFVAGGNYLRDTCQGSNCNLAANDTGLGITGDMLFGAIRKNAYFRTDINTLLDKAVVCLRDEIAAGGSLTSGKIAGADNNTCYGSGVYPLGYYPHYRDQVFVTGSATVNGAACAGALLFAGQRNTGQLRITAAEKSLPANYLEGTNLANFVAGTNIFSGPILFDRVTPGGQTPEQDIVRCIPVGASLNQVASPALTALGGQLTGYDPGSQTLTLGHLYSITNADRLANASAFFGCSWTPEVQLLGSGLRSYFKFRILDSGEGFTFAIIDSERNNASVCGAARQHLGYSGNNSVTPSIAYPKIGIEIDTTQTLAQQAAMNPAAANSLNNGRSDPSYTGGHFGIVYWGGESPIVTGGACPCAAPRYCSAGACYLPQEEDDNAHGLPTSLPAFRPPPRNPPAPATPTQGAGVYKLDASLSQIPVNKDIHVRVELSRTATDSTNRSKTYLLEVWLLKDSITDANQIAAMKNTTRPMTLLAPGFAAHVRDTPTIYDIQGTSCAGGSPCPTGQTCSASDNMCYAEAFHTARLGFTTSQSTAANDQIISITDFSTTWLP